MNLSPFILLLAVHAFDWQPVVGHTQIPLWPNSPPDAKPLTAAESKSTQSNAPVAGKPWTAVKNVSLPTITIYSPTSRDSSATVVVFPGGGYHELAIDLEGTEVCDWLTSAGITCALLKYRVPESGPYWDEHCQCHITPDVPIALEDAQRAMGLLRSHAAEWHIDPHKIGVLGFSAGGHLVAALSTHFVKRSYARVDAADDERCRPDFAIALYPGHLWIDDKTFELNPDIVVTASTPPTFLLHAEDDPVDSVNHSLVYFRALKKAGVPVEMHVYPHGGHAFGLRRTAQPITGWPALVLAWMEALGMTHPK